ncbi:MAG: Omp28-related outer membrane protein [Prevotella sp.]|nr:Omp28-related outer membrane protein [Prevotella sp.]
MNKTFTLLAAFVLSVTMATAQPKQVPSGFAEMKQVSQTGELARTLGASKAKAPQKKIEVASDEHILGYYDTDDLPYLIYENDVYGYGYLGFPTAPGETSVANLFEADMLTKFVGGEITKVRYAIADPTTVIKKVFIREIDDVDKDLDVAFGDCVAEVDMEDGFTAELGWNDVTLDEPVEIKENKIYVVGYTYMQTMYIYPIVTDELLEIDDYDCSWHFVAYGNSYWSYGSVWYGMNEDSDGYEYGHLCLQAVVKGGSFADHDINLRSLDIPKYVGLDNGLNYSFQIRNYGSEAPESYEVSLELDGEVIATLDTPVTLTNSYQTVSGTLALPENMDVTGESSTLRVYISKFNGEAPEEGSCTQTLEGSFVVFDKDVDRQMHLIEQFTSIYCGYCPLGHDLLEKLMELYPDKYAWVAVHGKMMDESTTNCDPYALEDGVYIDYFDGFESYLEYFLDVQGYPYASFDRTALNTSSISDSNYLSISLGYDEEYHEAAANTIDAAIDAVYESIPAFVPVDISATYNESTRYLAVTVSGTGVSIAKNALSDKVLYVYLLEDNITGRQEDYYSNPVWISDYTHNNVLRLPLTYYFGEDIGWTSDSSYSNSYGLTIDSSYVPANLKIVAFIAGPVLTFDSLGQATWGYQENAYVNNANMFKLSTITGVNAITTTENAVEKERYSVDGVRLSAPAKGVNIVKMSDGSVKKVVVK